MKRSLIVWLLIVVAVPLWVLGVYAGYYVVHKPLTLTNLQALANVAGDLLVWLAVLIVATALGSRLTRRIDYHSLLERLVFSAGLGLSLISLLTLGLGLVGLLQRWLFWALLLAGGLLLWSEIRRLALALRHARRPRWHGAWNTSLGLFVAASLLLTLLLALAPPVAWDALTYHLVGPARYLQAQRLTFEFDNYYLFFPQFSEMLFTAGMALKSDIAAQLLHYSYLLLTLGALVAFASRFWQRQQGLVAAALFLSIPTVVQIAAWAYVDLTLTFYSFAALYALLNWLNPAESQAARPAATGWLLLAGLFGGACAAIKYTGATSLLILGAVLVLALVRHQLPLRRFLSGSLVIGVAALIVAGPWYVKNAVVTGNPIYPLLWGGREWNDISTRWLLVLGQPMSLLDLLLVPWTLTVMGQQGTVAYDATYSPLFLALLPLLLLVRRQARWLAPLLLAAVVGYVAWILSGAASYGTFVLQGRMLLPIFAPLSLLCAYALDGLRRWDRKSFSLQRFLKMVVGLTLALGLLNQTLLTIGFNPLPSLVGLQNRASYQDRYTSQQWHQAISYANEHLTPDDKVLLVWEPRSYGLTIPHEADPLFDNVSQLLARYGSPEAVAGGLRQAGFTHLLVNQYIYPWIVEDYPLTPAERAAWEDFQARYLVPEALVHDEGDYLLLYRLPQSAVP